MTASFFEQFLHGTAQPILDRPYSYYLQLHDWTDRIPPAPGS